MLMILKILMMIMLMMKLWMLERRLLINEATDDADNEGLQTAVSQVMHFASTKVVLTAGCKSGSDCYL
jgi:hypothetical protein